MINVVETIIQPKKPGNDCFVEIDNPNFNNSGYPSKTYIHGSQSLSVISAVEVPVEDNGFSNGPEYHLSIAKQTLNSYKRCTSNEAKFVLAAFGMTDAKEDNHVPGGKVRNFWLPVNENLIGNDCPCVETETAMVEDKGDYIWRGINK